jgi:L-threonylcarbamoyladenylate synthase
VINVSRITPDASQLEHTLTLILNHATHPWRLRLARQVIQAGGLIAYPTEAVFGLGCHPLDPAAVNRLLSLKRRPIEKGLILISDSFERLQPFLQPLAEERTRVLLESWPGPTTWLVPAAATTPHWLTGSHSSLAVRVTSHPLAAALCRIADTPLVSTSANLGGHPPARTPLQVRMRCGPGIDLVLHGRTGDQDRPTVIRDALNGTLIRA